MSVIKSKRAESEMEFVYNARELELFTLRKCSSFPKSYLFLKTESIAKLAVSIHSHVKQANSIYPINQHEVQKRRDHFIDANAELNDLIGAIEVAQELFGINMSVMKGWSALIDKEIRLVKAVMKKDRERYKELP